MTKLAFLDADGEMGCRLCTKLVKDGIDLRRIEIRAKGIAALGEVGLGLDYLIFRRLP